MNISQNSQNENSQNNTKQFSEGSMDKEKNDDILHIKEEDKLKNDLASTHTQLSGSSEQELIKAFDKLKIDDKELIWDKINTQKDQDYSENYKEIIDKLRKENAVLKEENKAIKNEYDFVMANQEEYIEYLRKKADRLDIIFDLFPGIKKMFGDKDKGKKNEKKFQISAKKATSNINKEEKEGKNKDATQKKEDDKKWISNFGKLYKLIILPKI